MPYVKTHLIVEANNMSEMTLRLSLFMLFFLSSWSQNAKTIFNFHTLYRTEPTSLSFTLIKLHVLIVEFINLQKSDYNGFDKQYSLYQVYNKINYVELWTLFIIIFTCLTHNVYCLFLFKMAFDM